MRNLKQIILIALVTLTTTSIQAQSNITADQIINNYFENTGGMEAWGALQGMKMLGAANAQGMEIPIEIYQMKDGKQLLKLNIQGQSMTQNAFDGETMWTTNFMTMLPEKSDAEATENMKKQTKDFPSPFYNYKEKGFTVELLGKETKEGTETFKIKLTQMPIMINGVEMPNVSFHYFDTENFVPIATETEMKEGPMKGQMSSSTFSDYQEVDGLYFPFSIAMQGQGITIKEITVNPEIDVTMFAFPETTAPVETEKN
jgi:outer membrane lipoprotein-sorting protein